jgi:hypothetical protein
MANAGQAREIVDGLPLKDAVKALEEVTEWLESLNQTEGFQVDRRIENVELLDGAARRHQRALTQEYLSTPRVQKFQENRLWNAEFGYCRQLADAYIRCIRECLKGSSGSAAIQEKLSVLAARALRALALQLKWILLRYGLAEERIWIDLAPIYLIAEQQGVAGRMVEVYPGMHGKSTVRHEFLKALMLSASSTDGLPPLRQEIAERVIAHFADSFLLSPSPEGCTHCFDLSAPRVPARLFKGAEPSATTWFFGAGKALSRLELLVDQIKARDAVPQELDLGGSYDKDVVTVVLKHLGQHWSDKLPARNSERRPTAGRITVVPGMEEITSVLDPSPSIELNFNRNQVAESWIVENVSDGGYGAIIPPQKIDWVKVGALVGMKTETSNYLGIGVIRRITRDAHQQRRVGIQLLTKAAVPVKLAKANTMSSLNFDLTTDSAILLAVSADAQGEVGILMRQGRYNARDSLDMTVRDNTYLLIPARMVEEGDDFDWAQYKIMPKSA